MRFSYFIITLAFATKGLLALSPAGWRAQSIYQVLTDRFARTDGSTIATCNTGDQVYCGGSWQGIINHLDYIQNMGFTAVSSHKNCNEAAVDRSWLSPMIIWLHARADASIDMDITSRGESPSGHE